MKQVSIKASFALMMKGICQTIGCLFGLMGYGKEGKFAKCVWMVFALSCTTVATIIAGTLIYHLYKDIQRVYHLGHNEYCYYSRYLSCDVVLHDHGDGKAWIKNIKTGETTLTGVDWIAEPIGDEDSLVVYSDGKNRGYFNKYTGEVAIPAKYKHAWVFSDGIASVEENGIIKFIDTKGNQVFDRTFAYDPDYEGYVFHGGYCIVDQDNDSKYGLMNIKGVSVLPEEYDQIKSSCNLCYWTLTKGDESGVVDKELRPVLPMMTVCDIYVFDDEIAATMPDNTMRKYDLQGNLIDDFYISDFQYMEYELEETYQVVHKEYDEENDEHEYVSSTEHKMARSRLCKYTAGNNKEGLMDAKGHVITQPKYEYINAIGPDTYICTVSNGDKEILNGMGQKVR